MSDSDQLYRVVVSGREVDVQKVGKNDADYKAAEEGAIMRLTEAMRIMREHRADPSKLDSVHYFRGLDAAKDFARMCFKSIEEEISETRDEVESLR